MEHDTDDQKKSLQKTGLWQPELCQMNLEADLK